ncbi:hypothetical protein G4V62_02930 [Bacillaceae bacterium SIJ1]|uniref:hypothetical protein n=1 Tax=Litoribacterium kuwaitense TaxID=1398745 RepID=UPI0013EC0A2E|nr:hypothetical protein [Litoribacterium kuwaitense]NGP43953.1 hypothetical protein [Litoribacterium kuwaitense]
MALEWTNILNPSTGTLALTFFVFGMLFVLALEQLLAGISIHRTGRHVPFILVALCLIGMTSALSVGVNSVLSPQIVEQIDQLTLFLSLAIVTSLLRSLHVDNWQRMTNHLDWLLIGAGAVVVIFLPPTAFTVWMVGLLLYSCHLMWTLYRKQAHLTVWSAVMPAAFYISIASALFIREPYLFSSFGIVAVVLWQRIIQHEKLRRSLWMAEHAVAHKQHMNEVEKHQLAQRVATLRKAEHEVALVLAERNHSPAKNLNAATDGETYALSMPALTSLLKETLDHQKHFAVFTYHLTTDDPKALLPPKMAILFYHALTTIIQATLHEDIRHFQIECRVADQQQQQARIFLQGHTEASIAQLQHRLAQQLHTSTLLNNDVVKVNEQLLEVTLWNRTPM